MKHTQSHKKLASEGIFEQFSQATQSAFFSLATSVDEHIKTIQRSNEAQLIEREYEEAMRQLRLFCPFGQESKNLELHIRDMINSLISEKGGALAEIRLHARLRINNQRCPY